MLKKILGLFLSLVTCAATAQVTGVNPALYKEIAIPANAPQYFKPARTVTIAIVDDGFDADDTCLNKQFAVNAKEIPSNGIDDDKNGLVDDYTGWDFADNDNDVNPGAASKGLLFHGTAIAKILYDVLHELTGDGIVYFKFLPIKVKSDVGLNNYITEGYKGITYAVQQKADIIVCAWSGGNFGKDEQAVLDNALTSGAIVICAAGNYSALQPLYPGAYSKLIDVGAVDGQFKKMRYTNYGQFVDIAAPGDSVNYTTNETSETVTHVLSGTSAAVPVVAAVAAALLASDKSMTLQKVDLLLLNSALPLEAFNPSLYDGDLGAGIVQVDKLIRLWKQPVATGNYLDQPKGYIDFSQLSQPVTVVAHGSYKDYKLLLTSNSESKKAALGDIKLQYYQKGIKNETVFASDSLAYPKYITADSFRLSSVKKNKIKPDNYYWYYEAETIDSSGIYCSGTKTIEADSGIIEDGSKDANYSGRCDCKWQIVVPQGKRVSIAFKELDTQPLVDYVYIFNGTGTQQLILAKMSGNQLPPVVTSFGNKVLLWFVTDEFISGKGWKLEFKAVD